MSVAVEKGLVSVLNGTATVYPRLPQNPAWPAVRYQRISASRRQSIDGQNVGVVAVGLQVDIMSDDYDQAKALADTVRGVLNGYRGTWGTLTAHLVTLETENDMQDQEGDRVTHWVSQRYLVRTNTD